ncbi:hypothetical protein [Streptomyces achromogenes]|uniref:hypothetical protein n=1 Tax=Streptomyces achromogenes TaxID=67255 RepID=UPI003695E60D
MTQNDRAARVTAAYDVIVAFQRKANLSSLRLAQIRLNLAEEVAKDVVRSIFALKTPSPDGSTHYQSGWDDGLEAAMDAARDAVLAVVSVLVTDRATVRAETLREAADRIDRTDLPQDYVDMFDNGARWATAELRRLAGEAQQDEGPDDTVHACPGRWGGPNCRCFDGKPDREAQQDPAQDGEARCTCGHLATIHTGARRFCAVPPCSCSQYTARSGQPETDEETRRG